MKKILVLALVVVMVFSVCALTACGIETYTGEYKNETKNGTYGVKVDVAVKDGVIKSVKLYSDEDTGWMRTTPAEYWDGTSLGIGYEAAEAAYPEFLKLFECKTVEEIMEIPSLLGAVWMKIGKLLALQHLHHVSCLQFKMLLAKSQQMLNN